MSSGRLALLYKLPPLPYLFQSRFIPFYPFLSPDFSTMFSSLVHKKARLRPFCGFWRAFLFVRGFCSVYSRQSLQR